MLEQLKELLEMQRVLDVAILKEHGNIYNKKIADQMKIALFVEYVDALHFQMSLFNYYELGIHERNHDYNNMLVRSTDIIICLSNSTNHCDNILGLSYLFDLGYILGFTWSEIYETYKAKNAVNYERLNNGY